MLEPIREFGLEQLASSGELDAARMFHALHFLAFAARDAPTPTEPEPPAWVRRLAEEQDNLMATFDHLCDPATSELCLQFAVAYGPWLALSGPIQESWLRLRRAIEIASPEPNITRAHALFWASNLAMYAGETESATALCQEAINVADHLNDPIAKAAAIHSRAWHEEMQENWETASQLFEQALVTWEETDNAFMQAQALMLLGGHAYVKDDLAVARSREEKAAALFEQTAGPDWRGTTLVPWLHRRRRRPDCRRGRIV
jgi:tetratricopeptide (TPR) repeat protein